MTNFNDRTKSPTLRLHCPKCKSAGLIPWEKLDRTVVCGGCQSWYRIENTQLRELPPPTEDRYRVQVRTNSSAWQEHRAVVVRPKAFAKRASEALLEFASYGKTRWILAGATLSLLAFLVLRTDETVSRPAAVTVPVDLEDRAACLIESVARRDTDRLVLMTDPSLHRALRIWLGRGKDLPERIADETLETPLKGEVLKVESKPVQNAGERVETATIQSRLKLPDGKTFVLDQHWVKLAGGWAFRPPVLRNYVRRPARFAPETSRR
jgi:hypothetical protein